MSPPRGVGMLRLVSSIAILRSGPSRIVSRIGPRSESRAAAAALFASACARSARRPQLPFSSPVGDPLGDRLGRAANYCRKNNSLRLMHGGHDNRHTPRLALQKAALKCPRSKFYRQDNSPDAKLTWRRAMPSTEGLGRLLGPDRPDRGRCSRSLEQGFNLARIFDASEMIL